MLPSSADATGNELGPGAVLGKYRLIARLGEGGMGVVYSAVHERLGRPVAIKILLRGLSENTELASRFQMEAELVTRIGHPNIVAIYDFGRHSDGRLYYVMEIISGESLRGRMLRSPLGDQEIVEIFGRLLSALRAAHDIGVVHRDLKPDNVMLELGADGAVADVKLLDFGIAKIRDEQPGALPLQVVLENKDVLATAAGAIMGTPAYMAPEQIKNSSGVDKRADIYALGIMLYEALAGTRPFSGASPAELLGAHLYQQAEPPSATAKKQATPKRQVVWSKLDAVVLRAIAKEPTDRYQDCAALQADLESAWGQSFAKLRGTALSGTGNAATLAAADAVLAAPQKRRRRGVLVAAAAVAGLLLVGGGGYFLRVRSEQKQELAAQHNEQALALFAKAQAGGPAARRMLMESIEAVGARAHLPSVAQALGDDDPSVWRAALQAALLLGKPGDTVLAEPLQNQASQQIGPLAIDIAAARVRIGETEALSVLTAMLQSPIPMPEARLSAALALSQAGQLKALALRQALETALRAGSVRKTLRRDALVRLAVLQDPVALGQLHEAAQSMSGEPQTEALQVLALAKQPKAAVNLRLAAEVARGTELLEQAAVLAELGDRHAATLLLPLLKDPQPKVRQRALGALCRLAGSGHFHAYTKTLLPLLNDADPQVALIAAVALLGVGAKAPLPAVAEAGAQ